MSDVDCWCCGTSWETSHLRYEEVYRVVANIVGDFDARESLVAQWNGELDEVVDVHGHGRVPWERLFQEVGWLFASGWIYAVIHCPECLEGSLPDAETVFIASTLPELREHPTLLRLVSRFRGW